MRGIEDIHNVKLGAIFSYALIILNSAYALVITPYILGVLGEPEYGVYKTIAALSSSLMVLDMGIGGTATRYIAKYIAKEEENEIESFVSMIIGEAIILIGIVAIACSVLFFILPLLYRNGLDSSQITLAKKLFIILSINILFHLLENVFYGILAGYNRFSFSNGVKLLRILLRIVCIYIILHFYRSSIALVIIDLLLTLLLIIIDIIYVLWNIKITLRVSFGNWDKTVFYESFKYTGLMFLTSIAAQVNNNLDNVVIGSILGATFVAIYSMALTIYAMFENLSTAISGVMLPIITKALNDDPTGCKAQSIVISAGRIQFILLGAVYGGFIVLGKDFIHLWLGNGFEDVYSIAIILMTPSVLSLCINVCLSILRAKNMLGFRTIVMTGVTILNAIITVVGVNLTGYYAAAVGTSISVLLGSVIIMCIYYYRKLNISMLPVYSKIFQKSWICILISSVITHFCSKKINGTWINLLINIIVFLIIYSILLLTFGFNQSEKKQVKMILKTGEMNT